MTRQSCRDAPKRDIVLEATAATGSAASTTDRERRSSDEISPTEPSVTKLERRVEIASIYGARRARARVDAPTRSKNGCTLFNHHGTTCFANQGSTFGPSVRCHTPVFTLIA